MCIEAGNQWRPELEWYMLLLSAPVRDYSFDKIVGLEIFGIQRVKFGDQLSEGWEIKNELPKGNDDY